MKFCIILKFIIQNREISPPFHWNESYLVQSESKNKCQRDLATPTINIDEKGK